MIDIKSLRIGNIVFVKNEQHHPKLKKVPLIVTSINQGNGGYPIGLEHINQDPNKYYESYSQYAKLIEPIPISEELLLNCGFEKYFQFSFSKGSVRIELDLSDNWCFFWNINSKESIFICEVKYLHNIQNITYDLANEELQINL